MTTTTAETSPSPPFFFVSSRRRHTRCGRGWSSDVCSSDLLAIYDDEPVNEGMYNKTHMNDEDDLREVVLVITRFAKSEYMSFASVDNDITVSITDLTQSYVKGTFSGTVTHLQLEDSEVSITNGSFTVPRLENSMFFNNAFN